MVEAVDLLVSGKTKKAFCPVRPPGRHAEHDRAMGFCVFNNVAVGARYAVARQGLSGWQSWIGMCTMETEPSTRSVIIPGCSTSAFTSTRPTLGPEDLRKKEKEKALEPRPTFLCLRGPPRKNTSRCSIFISVGFDAHRDDPLADLRLSSDSFGRLTSLLSGVAGLYAEDRIVSVLEGGYNLKALSESVGFHLSALVLQRKEMDSKKVSYLPTCRSGCTRKSADADGWRHEVIFGRY